MIGCASGRVVLDNSHPEHLCGTRLIKNVGELQAMFCAGLWLAEQLRIDHSMRQPRDPREKSQRGNVEPDG